MQDNDKSREASGLPKTILIHPAVRQSDRQTERQTANTVLA